MKSMLKSLMSVAVAALAFTSCSNDATEDVMPNVGSQTLKVNATIDQTRTTLDGNHVNLTWAKDDQIHLYIGASATTAKSIDPVTGGEITGVTYNPGDKVYAYYSLPEDGKPSKSAKEALINIIQKQTQEDASIFAGKNLPMVASSSIENGIANLLFKPVGCVLVFNVYGQGTTAGEKVKSIKFETSKGCYGYDYCDLTADVFKYEAYSSGTNATVTLTNPATIGASKPSDTKVGENQIYLVVAQAEYPAGSKFTVTTDVNNAYNFTTTTALDCSAKTARVVNLNLKNATELKPAIEVPSVPEQKSEGGDLVIDGIVLKNITASDVEVAVYNDDALTQSIADPWIKFSGSPSATLVNRTLNCTLDPNTNAEARTAYIGIKYGETVKAAIAVKQVGAGSTPAVSSTAKYVPEDMGYTSGNAVEDLDLDGGSVHLAFAKKAGTQNPPKYFSNEDSALRCYGGNTITVSSDFKITKIVITRGAKDPNNRKWLVDGIELSNDTWTGESNEVVLTVSETTGQIRVETMEITYVESNEPKIIAPTTVADKQPAEGSTLTIKDIVFKNIDVANVTTGVYSNTELTESTNVAWLTIANADLASGTLSCNVAANDGAERTAYIGIKGGGVQAAIAVTQLAQGAVAAPDPTTAVLSTVIAGSYGPHDNDTWIVTCGGNTHTLGSNSSNDNKCNLKGYAALAEVMGLSENDRAAAVISKKVLPAGYNTAKLEYSKTNEDMFVGIAFSTDNVTWTKIKDFVELKETAAAGSQTYSFTQQEAGYYAFVAKGNAAGMRIQTCKITYSQSQE